MRLLHFGAFLATASFQIAFAIDCFHYPVEIRTREEYSKFASDCAGERHLGFENDDPWVFNASLLTESEFNKLFKKAEEIRMSVFIQNTNFKKPYLKKLRVVHVREGTPSFRIENNADLYELKTPPVELQTEPKNAVVQVYYYANGRGKDKYSNSSDPFENIRKLCPSWEGCHFGKDRECSRIAEPITHHNIDKFLQKCSGKKIIKAAPGVKLELDLGMLSSCEVNELFRKARQIFICIRSVGTHHRQIKFRKLQRFEACEPGSNALLVENNAFLEEILFPCKNFTNDGSFRIRGNRILNSRNIQAIMDRCGSCDIQEAGEHKVMSPNDHRSVCENYPVPKSKKDYERLVNTCNGVKQILFDSTKFEYFDASLIPQQLFEDLFRKVEKINFGIKLANTRYTRLSLPNLQMIQVYESVPVIKIEDNPLLEHLIAHYDVEVASPDANVSTILSGNRRLTKKFLERWDRLYCKYMRCEKQLHVDCAKLGEMGAEELALKCSGARVIAPMPGVELNIDLDELDQDKVEALFDNLEEAQMCIRAIDTDHVEYNFEKLNKLRPCAPGKPVLDIRNNKNLFRLSFNKKLEIASPAIIRGNPSLNPHFIGRLLKLKENCPGCDFQRSKEVPIPLPMKTLE